MPVERSRMIAAPGVRALSERSSAGQHVAHIVARVTRETEGKCAAAARVEQRLVNHSRGPDPANPWGHFSCAQALSGHPSMVHRRRCALMLRGVLGGAK